MGLTRLISSNTAARSVHPHVRGAHVPLAISIVGSYGPSPRAWGSPFIRAGLFWVSRSIPTCVGLTSHKASSVHASAVHPHVRGAHTIMSPNAEPAHGPSPRAWGSLLHPGGAGDDLRSIPTCVGLTLVGRAEVVGFAVHPHVRGAHYDEACRRAGRTLAVHPHVRGAH
ncbi:hypothetical protein B005_0311 [Nocardiopsis alba ATCC BAA-2165]|uniref:Uncharacterized protein n=1 Tax=Nocardiopsis alba (strain ATCC BAA-2165 / BE74) TaxID=1205910 RepID=J7LF32_NOCAA|nr:hypothetical protein B005_0311 [Nocardiopsis alba ATCC BAA-2165]